MASSGTISKQKYIFQKTIASYLQKDLSYQQIFQKIQDSNDYQEVGSFLYLSKQYNTLIEYTIKCLEAEKPVPWSFVLATLINHDLPIEKSMFKILWQGFLKAYSSQEESLLACESLEDLSKDFKKFSGNYRKSLKLKKEVQEEELLDRLEFAKAQNLMEEEQHIIDLLIKKESHNKKYFQLRRELEERKALKNIEENKLNLKKDYKLQQLRRFRPETSQLKTNWVQKIQDHTKQKPTQVKNLALFLTFLGWPDESSKLLKDHLEDLSDYWFYLEWLIETEQHTIALEVINQLLNQLQKDPEVLLPLNYLKAQALYYLGQTKRGIDSMQDIVAIKPFYRSATFLLDEWKNPS